MAKKQIVNQDFLVSTAPAEPGKEHTPRGNGVVPISAGLRPTEISEIEAIIAEHPGLSRSSLLRFAILHFLEDYKAGKTKLPVRTEQITLLNLD